MTNSYLAGLQRWAAEQRAQRAAQRTGVAVDPLAALKARIRDWWGALPLEARAEFYFMSDLQRLLNASPQALGLALAATQWERRRVWKKGEPFRQRWYPPTEWRESKDDQSE